MAASKSTEVKALERKIAEHAGGAIAVAGTLRKDSSKRQQSKLRQIKSAVADFEKTAKDKLRKAKEANSASKAAPKKTTSKVKPKSKPRAPKKRPAAIVLPQLGQQFSQPGQQSPAFLPI
jgi:hypothetical protein